MPHRSHLQMAAPLLNNGRSPSSRLDPPHGGLHSRRRMTPAATVTSSRTPQLARSDRWRTCNAIPPPHPPLAFPRVYIRPSYGRRTFHAPSLFCRFCRCNERKNARSRKTSSTVGRRNSFHTHPRRTEGTCGRTTPASMGIMENAGGGGGGGCPRRQPACWGERKAVVVQPQA